MKSYRSGSVLISRSMWQVEGQGYDWGDSSGLWGPIQARVTHHLAVRPPGGQAVRMFLLVGCKNRRRQSLGPQPTLSPGPGINFSPLWFGYLLAADSSARFYTVGFFFQQDFDQKWESDMWRSFSKSRWIDALFQQCSVGTGRHNKHNNSKVTTHYLV